MSHPFSDDQFRSQCQVNPSETIIQYRLLSSTPLIHTPFDKFQIQTKWKSVKIVQYRQQTANLPFTMISSKKFLWILKNRYIFEIWCLLFFYPSISNSKLFSKQFNEVIKILLLCLTCFNQMLSYRCFHINQFRCLYLLILNKYVWVQRSHTYKKFN